MINTIKRYTNVPCFNTSIYSVFINNYGIHKNFYSFYPYLMQISGKSKSKSINLDTVKDRLGELETKVIKRQYNFFGIDLFNINGTPLNVSYLVFKSSKQIKVTNRKAKT